MTDASAIPARGKLSISRIWSSSHRTILWSTSTLMQREYEVYECINPLASYSYVVRSELLIVQFLQSVLFYLPQHELSILTLLCDSVWYMTPSQLCTRFWCVQNFHSRGFKWCNLGSWHASHCQYLTPEGTLISRRHRNKYHIYTSTILIPVWLMYLQDLRMVNLSWWFNSRESLLVQSPSDNTVFTSHETSASPQVRSSSLSLMSQWTSLLRIVLSVSIRRSRGLLPYFDLLGWDHFVLCAQKEFRSCEK